MIIPETRHTKLNTWTSFCSFTWFKLITASDICQTILQLEREYNISVYAMLYTYLHSIYFYNIFLSRSEVWARNASLTQSLFIEAPA